MNGSAGGIDEEVPPALVGGSSVGVTRADPFI